MKALFFDFDGTLTDINQREIEVIYDTVNHFDIPVSKTRVKQLCVQLPSHTDVFKETGLELNDEAVKYWTAAFVKRYHLSVLRKDVESTLRTLSKISTLVCVTSRETLAEVIRELKFLHIDALFNHVVTRDVAAKHFGLNLLPFFPYHEQRKRLYHCALAIAKSSPRNTVVIGDMGRELKPAQELGIMTVGLVTYESRKEELQEASDIVISNIAQLSKTLLEL